MFKKVGFPVRVVAFSLSALMILTAAKNESKKELTIQDKMNDLSASAQGWSALSTQEKGQAVNLIMDLFKIRENAAMLKSTDFYVKKIDESLAKDVTMGSLGLPGVVKILAVMEYDYYNGQDKDQLARQLLGPALYEENRRRRAREAGMPGIF